MSDHAYTPEAAPAPRHGRPSASRQCEPGRTCRLKLSFSIFFDGTRNSKYQDVPSGSHSNIARLFEVCEERPSAGVYRLYVQGVGTPFADIGEPVPHEYGASMGAMGAPRIRYALLYVVNQIAQKVSDRYIVPGNPRSIAAAVSSASLLPRWRRQLTHMLTASENPKIDEIVFDVFGFSRGATAARSFVHQLKRNFCDVDGIFCGVPMRIRFLGLFDTVASVGLADSAPAPGVEGHQDWGDESLLTIPDDVEQCVHMVAAHEARASFPLDSVRRARGGYPSRCVEIVYPGMHSDVGGGYGLYTQGKGTLLPSGGLRQWQSDKLSQIALNEMYRRAVAARVPLIADDILKAENRWGDFELSPELQRSYAAYQSALGIPGSAPLPQQMLAHRRLYLGWRKQVLAKSTFDNLHFVRRAGRQEQIDMIAANDELRRHFAAFAEFPRQQEAYMQRLRGPSTRELAPPKPPLGWEFKEDWDRAPAVTEAVASFFAQYVHDSRAHFLLTDPQSDHDHQIIRNRLEAKDRDYRRRLEQHAQDVAAYERMHGEKERAYLTRGEYSGYTATTLPHRPVHPRDPLSTKQRENLQTYRAGRYPIYDDDNPASASDGTAGVLDVIAAMSRRREMGWTYLHKRQLFAPGRLRY
ncbi:DUF2235 domain-containing protein [Luteimonas yindakuii]|uniref:T6SS phospholipase effector Tle1-like catalytic domain-containing protein n=1 Tax=Luteimonas yindakuii TaxID=2565782 RepID=UPI001107676B|nr:DUF2235 domain-containing protein [Luteimonas yindakuii]QCU72361.1 DUF2235 domain-containing protein [Luteimonas yindakuii]